MSADSSRAIAELCESLINERAIEIVWSGDRFTAHIRDVAVVDSIHVVMGTGSVDPITGDVMLASDEIVVDDRLIGAIGDLRRLGFTDDQLDRVQTHIDNTVTIEDVITSARDARPKVLDHLGLSAPLAGEQTETMIGALGRLAAPQAFVLADACGNADGLSGSPIRNLMSGVIDGVIDYHPVVRAFRQGTTPLVALRYHDEIAHHGKLPAVIEATLRESLAVDSLAGIGFAHPYSVEAWKRSSDAPPYDVVGTLDAFALMSKRSFVPVGADFQIKVSLDGRATAHDRNMHPGETFNAVANSRVFSALADRNRLPANTWVMPELMYGSVADDRRTTFLVRGGMRDAMSNARGGAQGGTSPGIDDRLTPIAGCVLWSRNLVDPTRTVFDELVSTGFDPMNLYSEIVSGLVAMYLDFVRTGIVVEGHSQNVLYLFDLQESRLEGLVLRDLADCYFMPDRLGALHVEYEGISAPDVDEMIVSRLDDDPAMRRALTRKKFDHKIVHLHVEPLARLVAKHYGVEVPRLLSIVVDAVSHWRDRNADFDLEPAMDLCGFNHINRLGATLGLVGEQYRRSSTHGLADLARR